MILPWPASLLPLTHACMQQQQLLQQQQQPPPPRSLEEALTAKALAWAWAPSRPDFG